MQVLVILLIFFKTLDSMFAAIYGFLSRSWVAQSIEIISR